MQAQLNEVAAGLNQSANEVVQASRGTTQDLARATSKFGQDFSNFLDAGVDMAGTSQVSILFYSFLLSNPHLVSMSNLCRVLSSVLQSKEDQTQVVSNLKTISMSSSKLLLAAKALSTDPNSPNLKNQLAAAAR